MDCGLISQNHTGHFSKRPGPAWVAGLTGHVALRDWPVHGPRLWTGAGVRVHRSTVDRGRCAVAEDGRPRRRSMAARLRLAVTALRCRGGRAKGTGVMRTPRRTRCTYKPSERETEEDGPRGGAARRRPKNSGDAVHAKGRDRESGRSSGEFLTSIRSSGIGFRRRGWGRGGDHRRRVELGRWQWWRRC
jgi:hypothetical protein